MATSMPFNRQTSRCKSRCLQTFHRQRIKLWLKNRFPPLFQFLNENFWENIEQILVRHRKFFHYLQSCEKIKKFELFLSRRTKKCYNLRQNGKTVSLDSSSKNIYSTGGTLKLV